MMRRLVSTLAVAACCAMELRVATHVGSRFLDKKVDLSVDGASCTIGDIKDLVRAKFDPVSADIAGPARPRSPLPPWSLPLTHPLYRPGPAPTR